MILILSCVNNFFFYYLLYTALNSPNRDLRLIRPVLNLSILQFSYIILYIWFNKTSLNSPSGQRAKRAKIKRGRNFPCIQYYQSADFKTIHMTLIISMYLSIYLQINAIFTQTCIQMVTLLLPYLGPPIHFRPPSPTWTSWSVVFVSPAKHSGT